MSAPQPARHENPPAVDSRRSPEAGAAVDRSPSTVDAAPRSSRRSASRNWLPLSIGIVLALLTTSGWLILRSERRQQEQALLHTAATNIQAEIVARVETRLHALQRLALRTEHRGAFRPAEWEADAQLYVRDYPELEAVEWVDAELKHLTAVPPEHVQSPLHRHILADPHRREMLLQARDARTPAVRYRRLPYGDRDFVVVVFPVYWHKEFGGAVLAVFRGRELLERIVKNVAPGYALSVTADGQQLYSRPEPGSTIDHRPLSREERLLDFYGSAWRLSVWPGAQLPSRASAGSPASPLGPVPTPSASEGQGVRWGTSTPKVVLALGLLMSALVAMLVSLAQQARRRSRQFQAANFLLKTQIEKRRRGEQELKRLNRSLRALSACNQALVHATDERDAVAERRLLDQICRIFVEQCGYLLAWVGYAEQDESKTVRVVAAAGAAKDYMVTGMVSWADVDRGRGPTGTAIRSGRPIVCRDTLTDPDFAPWRERALQRGFRSCIALPLLIGSRLTAQGSRPREPEAVRREPCALGALSLYAPTPAAFDDEEVRLLSELAQDLAFGIQTLRERAEHDRAEERLRYLAAIVEDSDDAIYSKSLDGTLVSWNRGAEKMYGYTAAEAIGRNASFLSPPDRENELDGLLRKIAEGHTIDHYETVRVRKDGARLDISLTLSPLHVGVPSARAFTHDGVDDRHGNVVGASSIARDITERKQAERRLYDQQFYTRSLIEASLDPLMTTDPAGIITDVNQQMELLTGCVRCELIGSEFKHYCSEPERAEEGIRQVLQKGNVTDYELTVRSREGRETVVSYNATVYRDWGGKVVGVFAAARDITDRKRAEQELLRYAAELARSNAELQDFASIASHDLQEPLRKVMAFGDRLQEHCGPQLDDLGRDFLARMQNAAARMSHLINALLDYSRVSTRAQPFQPVDLQQVLLEVVADLEAAIEEVHAQISVGVLPRLVADRTQMRQLLQNLLSNAIKFHAAGERPQVWVDSRPLAANWEIRVRDNGIGFAEKHLDRIFRPFQRLHGRSEFAGSGMGLAICRKIVARHGGTLTATSRPGQGATFVVTLPAVAEERNTLWNRPENPSASCLPKTMTTITS